MRISLLIVFLCFSSYALGPLLPAHENSAPIYYYTGFILEYSGPYKEASWVWYLVTKKHTLSQLAARNKVQFSANPKIPGSVKPEDYRGSGFDKACLCPPADCQWSAEAMKESFFMTNVAPQRPAFSRGVWSRLEKQVRVWAKKYDSLQVVTGPVLRLELKQMRCGVSIPDSFFKAIMYYKNNQAEGIGFLMANRGSSLPLDSFMVPIDTVEARTGLDLFHGLPDSLETAAESRVDREFWK